MAMAESALSSVMVEVEAKCWELAEELATEEVLEAVYSDSDLGPFMDAKEELEALIETLTAQLMSEMESSMPETRYSHGYRGGYYHRWGNHWGMQPVEQVDVSAEIEKMLPEFLTKMYFGCVDMTFEHFCTAKANAVVMAFAGMEEDACDMQPTTEEIQAAWAATGKDYFSPDPIPDLVTVRINGEPVMIGEETQTSLVSYYSGKRM